MVEVSVKNGEQLERALRRFKKKWERAGVLREVKRKSFYIKLQRKKQFADVYVLQGMKINYFQKK